MSQDTLGVSCRGHLSPNHLKVRIEHRDILNAATDAVGKDPIDLKASLAGRADDLAVHLALLVARDDGTRLVWLPGLEAHVLAAAHLPEHLRDFGRCVLHRLLPCGFL